MEVTTKSGVEKLSLKVTSDDAMQCVLAIRNQEALGRLRYLDVQFDRPNSSANTCALLDMLVDVSGLEELHVSGKLSDLRHMPRPQPPVIESSLKRFSWTLSVHSGELTCSFANIVLATHVATLEAVDIRFGTHWGWDKPVCRTTTLLLARMPRLRVLQSYSLRGLEVVAACKSLREVTLNLYPNPGTDTEAAVRFLRRATQLRQIELVEFIGNEGRELLQALASSGRSAVESLMFSHTAENLYEELPIDVEPVLRALPSLPALRHLELHLDELDDPDELLSSFTPATAPALRTIRLISAVFGCVHDWMHRPSFKKFLAANPSLQVCMDMTKVCDDPFCHGCLLACRNHVLTTLKNWSWDDNVDWLSVVIDHEKSTQFRTQKPRMSNLKCR